MKQLLTGKCLEDYERWYKENNLHQRINFEMHLHLPLAFTFGVIQDFGDSEGFKIAIDPSARNEWYIYILDSKFMGSYRLDNNLFRSLRQAREGVIEQFNKVYNDSKK